MALHFWARHFVRRLAAQHRRAFSSGALLPLYWLAKISYHGKIRRAGRRVSTAWLSAKQNVRMAAVCSSSYRRSNIVDISSRLGWSNISGGVARISVGMMTHKCGDRKSVGVSLSINKYQTNVFRQKGVLRIIL